MYCLKCGKKEESGETFCSNCGNNTFRKKTNTLWVTLGIISTFIILLVIGLGLTILFLSIDKNETANNKKSPDEQIEKLEKDEEPKITVTEKEKTEVIKETMPKVYTIQTDEGLGSGFLYQKGGYIVTNAHVVAGYTNVTVRNSSGQNSPAKVIGISDQSDIALLFSEEYAQTEPLALEMGSSIVGTEVIALGSPQGFENSATIGYLTGVNRDMELGSSFIYEQLYQIDAQIDQGSSGGPLVDAKTGKVIGINSLIYQGNDTFGFSIPLHTVTALLNNWISNPMHEQAVISVFNIYEEYTSNEQKNSEDEYDKGEGYDNYESEYIFEAESLSNFILYFVEYYEEALNYQDFYWIQDMLLPESNAYIELEQAIYEISGEEMVFDFTSYTVTSMDDYGDYAIVYVNEQFDFYNGNGEHEFYSLDKEYTVVINSEGYYQITDIYIAN